MPIYEYRCSRCGHEFEVIQRISDRPLTRCEDCGGRLEKLLSRSAFLLKGGGWYADGYGGGASGKADSAEKKQGAAPAEAKKSASAPSPSSTPPTSPSGKSSD